MITLFCTGLVEGRSREGAWIEIDLLKKLWMCLTVAPARERGLKLRIFIEAGEEALSRSREGAWIEMPILAVIADNVLSRSREGAWIEISLPCARLI